MIGEMQFLNDLNYVRVGGSEGEKSAADYLVKCIKELGVNAKQETFAIQGADVETVSLEVIKPYKKKIDCKAYLCCANTDGTSAELYYYRGRETCTCHDVKGKIVLFEHGLPYWQYKDIVDKGAVGFIVCNGDLIDNCEEIDERELRKDLRKIGELPGVAINVSSAFEMIQKKATQVKIVTRQKEKKIQSRNVVATIKGECDKEIIFTAHYDSTALSRGVYDNLTGSIGILKVLEYYATHKPKRTLTFVFCGSEEKGLLGSKAYVEKHKKNLDKIELNINLDMIGSAMGAFLACVTGEDKLAHYIEYFSKEKGFSLDSHTGVYSSDSTPFADQGIPAVSFARMTGLSPIHNKYDNIKMINEDILKADIDFILSFTKRMVDSAFMPVERVMPEKMKEELDYYLMRKKRGAK